MTTDPVVHVRRQWNHWEVASYPLSALENPHWSAQSGGFRSPAPQNFIHGYVWCDGALEGEVGHSCLHGEGPHRIKVCVVAKDNDKSVIVGLRAIAGPKPAKPR